ncbi:hypothetical protein EDEG_03358 [Edhazardia aedis USNM 41457]|uniref:J domain-containing protein n=1 Tax=Edhazardia aedis (strain USNM 41457) TaxID=1003232 RepID=J9D3T5_EDHAE|nr:hypothetical protein EDEG_03358 [Edhazardia aedis USNM 41457]|eukprot:EJW02204.1 hypothetical protein EDEG_03358 [Edhazardia aedis USNM 41457]
MLLPILGNSFLKKIYYKLTLTGFKKKMDRKEAFNILGIGKKKFKDQKEFEKEVNSSYKKLMLINHPDRDGSAYLTQKITEAKKKLIPR